MLRILLSLLLLLPLATITEAAPTVPALDRTADQGADRGVGSLIVADAAGAPEATEAPVILMLGDSLSAAYGMPLDQGWVSLLQTRIDERDLPHRVVNAAISGETVAGGLSRLPALLAEHAPTLVLIALGANDGLRGFAPAQIENDLATLVEQAQAADADVVVIGVRLPPNYGPAYTERFQRLFATVADRTGVALVPKLLVNVAEDRRLMQADGLHPTAEAQPLILETVWPVLAPLLDR